MKNKNKNILQEGGFTLLEMLMVMFIISILLLLIIPNITAHKDNVTDTGCEAYAEMVGAQALAYELAHGEEPTNLDVLVTAGYINSTTCSNGTQLILVDGLVEILETE